MPSRQGLVAVLDLNSAGLPCRFSFIARYIRAYRQDARTHPGMPDVQRSL